MRIKNLSTEKLSFVFTALTFVFLLSNCKKDEQILPNEIQTNSTIIDSVDTPLTPETGSAVDTLPTTETAPAVNTPATIETAPAVNTPSTTETNSAVSSNGSLPTLSATAPAVSSIAYNIANALPAGYVKDGSKDYTTYIQAAVNKYAEIVFPGFPVLINDKGLTIPSNRKIWFLSGSVLKLKPSALDSYKMIEIKNRTNVTLINPVLIGDRQQHLATTGEHGTGISITGASSSVKIYSPKVSQTWGDGIYIGGTSKDILVDKARISKAGRNGITIVSGINITLADPYIEYSDRINPMAGIDIEPNETTDNLQNIKITNPVTVKNGWTGIQIGMSQFYYDQINTRKQVSIEVINHKDEGSVLNGVWLSTAGKGRAGYDLAGNVVSGSIKFTNPVWKNNQLPIKGATLSEKAITFTLYKPTVINTDGLTLTTSALQTLFSKNIGKVTKVITY
jgi:hypothetical protein